MTLTRGQVEDEDHTVQKLEWKHMDGQTDGRTGAGDCITSRVNAVGKCKFAIS